MRFLLIYSLILEAKYVFLISSSRLTHKVQTQIMIWLVSWKSQFDLDLTQLDNDSFKTKQK